MEEGDRVAWCWEHQGPQNGAGVGQEDPETQRAAVLWQSVFGGGLEVYRTVLWTLLERERVGRFGRMALKHV